MASRNTCVVDEAEGLIVAHKTDRLTHLSERAQLRTHVNHLIALWDAARPAHEMHPYAEGAMCDSATPKLSATSAAVSPTP